jgi:hypothetical protein
MTVSYETRDSYIGYVFWFRLFGDGGTLEVGRSLTKNKIIEMRPQPLPFTGSVYHLRVGRAGASNRRNCVARRPQSRISAFAPGVHDGGLEIQLARRAHAF